jgi:hypothetical protein
MAFLLILWAGQMPVRVCVQARICVQSLDLAFVWNNLKIATIKIKLIK